MSPYGHLRCMIFFGMRKLNRERMGIGSEEEADVDKRRCKGFSKILKSDLQGLARMQESMGDKYLQVKMDKILKKF